MQHRIKYLSLLLVVGLALSCDKKTTFDQSIPEMNATKNISGYADVNGIKMYYEIHGQGEPLVLIHGGGSTIESNWSAMLPLLSPYFKVIAVEMQAHGRTTDRNTPETFEQDADDVAGLLQALDIPKTNLMGFSNGGNTAMQVAIRHPEVVNKMIVASSFYQREGMMAGFFDFMETASLANMPQPLQDAFLKVNPDTAKLRVMHDKDRDRMRAFKDWTDESLRAIKAPTLLINADKDVVRNEHVLKMKSLIPTSEVMIVPGIHGAYLGEVCSAEKDSKIPAAIAAVVIDFLQK